MLEARYCAQCGTTLEEGAAPEGLCPRCLMQLGLRSGGGAAAATEALGTTPSPPRFTPPGPDELAPHFPQLEIHELLGQGGMGAVYKARQPGLDRLVALKVLPPEAGRDPAFAERFTREARALAKLNHPNIVTVYDFGEAAGSFYLIMEFVDGINLRQLLRDGKLPPEQALSIVPHICDALEYAHGEGIVHRDIKPENLLLDAKGRVKIADFGLAKLVVPGRADVTLTAPQQVMGTLHYMAPEQMEKPLTVDHRADIYSLGVVFYEMLTGELPLGRFAPPSQKVKVDVKLDEVVLRALEKEPDRRYQHVSDVKTAVERISTGAATAQPTPTSTRTTSLPFALSAYEGLAVVRGLLRLNDDDLILEFEVKDSVLGLVKSSAKDVRIQFGDIQSIYLKAGWLGTTLVIRTSTLSALAKVPTSSQGQVWLKIARRDRNTAERFVAKVRLRLPHGAFANGESEPAADPTSDSAPGNPPSQVARRRVLWRLVVSAIALSVGYVAATLLELSAVVWLSFSLLVVGHIAFEIFRSPRAQRGLQLLSTLVVACSMVLMLLIPRLESALNQLYGFTGTAPGHHDLAAGYVLLVLVTLWLLVQSIGLWRKLRAAQARMYDPAPQNESITEASSGGIAIGSRQTLSPSPSASAATSETSTAEPAIFGYEYRSKTTLWGLPLVHICWGFDPQTGRSRTAKGIIAIGSMAVGVLAIGGGAFGGIAIGGGAIGLVSLGGAAFGLVLALGGMAVGTVAVGGGAIGYYALGGGAFGPHALGGNVQDPEAITFFGHWMGAWIEQFVRQ